MLFVLGTTFFLNPCPVLVAFVAFVPYATLGFVEAVFLFLEGFGDLDLMVLYLGARPFFILLLFLRTMIFVITPSSLIKLSLPKEPPEVDRRRRV